MTFDGAPPRLRRAGRGDRGPAAPRPALPPAARVRPARARAARVWVDDPHFNARYHIRHTALPAPGGRRGAQAARRPRLRPAAGPLQAAVGDLARRGARRATASRCCPRPTTRSSTAVSGVDIVVGPVRRLGPTPRRPRRRPPPWLPRPVPTAPSCWPRRCSSARRSPPRRCAALRRADPRPAPGRGQRSPAAWRASARWPGRGLSPAPRVAAERHDRPAPPLHVGRRRPRAVQGHQGRARRHGQRRRADRRRAARCGALAARPRRADRRASCCKAMVPVSVRADAERGALGNRVAAMWAPLPVGVARPGERASTTVHEAMARPQGVRSGRRRRDADAAGRLRAADDHEPGRAAAVAPAVLQPRRHQRARARSSRCTCSAAGCAALYPVVPLAPTPGAGHRDHELQRAAGLRPARRLRRAARPRRDRRRPRARDRRRWRAAAGVSAGPARRRGRAPGATRAAPRRRAAT